MPEEKWAANWDEHGLFLLGNVVTGCNCPWVGCTPASRLVGKGMRPIVETHVVFRDRARPCVSSLYISKVIKEDSLLSIYCRLSFYNFVSVFSLPASVS
jgi:hypothetical protein